MGAGRQAGQRKTQVGIMKAGRIVLRVNKELVGDTREQKLLLVG